VKKYLRNLIYSPFANEFLLSLVSFFVDSMEKFKINSDIHNINIRHKHDAHVLSTNFTSYYKSTYYAEITLFSTFPGGMKILDYDVKVFKPALKFHLSSHFLFSEEELLQLKIIKYCKYLCTVSMLL
jgi:hypothetical protein